MSCLDIFNKVIEREDLADIPITYIIRVVMASFEEMTDIDITELTLNDM